MNSAGNCWRASRDLMVSQTRREATEAVGQTDPSADFWTTATRHVTADVRSSRLSGDNTRRGDPTTSDGHTADAIRHGAASSNAEAGDSPI
jgi:hypothetical protein